MTQQASPPLREPVELRSALVAGVDFEERRITLVAVPYDEETVVEYRGQLLRESVEPGAFDGIESRSVHVTANRDHDYSRTIGKAISYRTADPAGLVAEIQVSRTALGDETLQLAADGVLKASVGMLVRRSDQTIREGLRRIHRAFLDHISLVPNPAYQGASVLAVRQEQRSVETEEPSTPNMDAVLALLAE